MRRWLVWLPLLGTLGCSLNPESTSRPGPQVEEVERAPARPAWQGKKLPDTAGMEKLARSDPVSFVGACVERYDREVRGYRAMLAKRERVRGNLYPPEGKPLELVRCCFREKPFSVRMEWVRGERQARKMLFVKGENNNQMLVVPSSWRGWFVSLARRDPEGEEARSSSRYPVTEFGIQVGMRRTQSAWQKASKRGELHMRFNGAKRLEELKGRPCWELKRARYEKPEDDGIVEATLYFDPKTWLQVGSVLRGEDGGLVAEYYFTDVELNPEFAADTFTEAGLRKK